MIKWQQCFLLLTEMLLSFILKIFHTAFNKVGIKQLD